MKLIVAIVHEREKHKLAETLTDQGFSFTKLGSAGGFLSQGSVTFLIGVEDEEIARVLLLLKSTCGVSERYVNVPTEAAALPFPPFSPHPVAAKSGGAVAFVLSVEAFERF